MSENEANQSKKRERDKAQKMLIAAIVIVVVGMAFRIFTDFRSRKKLQAEFDQTKTQLTVQLDSIGGALSSKIVTLAELGKNIDSLVVLKDSITAQRDQLQRTRKANKALIQRLDRKVSGYQELLLAKDQEIKKLQEINTALLVENNELKVDKNELNATIRKQEERERELQQKVSLVAKLKAENVKIFSINRRGKEREGNFRSRQAQKVKVTFNLADNEAAPVAGHQIMVQITDPAGKVIFDVAKGSGSFKIDGKEQFYTAMQEIVFDNSKQVLTFVYDKGSAFKKGKYKIILLSDTYEIGRANFSVR